MAKGDSHEIFFRILIEGLFILFGVIVSTDMIKRGVKRAVESKKVEIQKAKKDTVYIFIEKYKALPDSLILKSDPEDSSASTRKKN